MGDPILPDYMNKGASTPAATLSGGSTAPAAPSGKKPSLWRNLLAGALQGMAGGFANPDNPGEGRKTLQEIRMAPQRLELQQRQVAAQEQGAQADFLRAATEAAEAPGRDKLREAQSALALANALHLEKLIDSLPQEMALKKMQSWAEMMRALADSGLQPVTEIEDNENNRSAFLQYLAGNGGKVTDFIFGPSTTPGYVTVLKEVGPSLITEQQAGTLSRAVPGLRDLSGLPAKDAYALAIQQMRGNTEREVAHIQRTKLAASEDEAYKLSLKDAISAARSEASQIVEAESLLPHSKKSLKSESDIRQFVNRRAQELLDLSGQLRRSGIADTSAVMGVLGKLKAQQKQGATAAELKQGVAVAAATGQLTPAEIVALYDQLGLTPNLAPQAVAQPVPSHSPTSVMPTEQPVPGKGSSSIQ